MRRIRLRLIDVRGVPNVPEGVRQIAQDDNGDDADIEDSHYTFRTQLIAYYKYAKEHGHVAWLTRR